jgi:hypothetical protein
VWCVWYLIQTKIASQVSKANRRTSKEGSARGQRSDWDQDKGEVMWVYSLVWKEA